MFKSSLLIATCLLISGCVESVSYHYHRRPAPVRPPVCRPEPRPVIVHQPVIVRQPVIVHEPVIVHRPIPRPEPVVIVKRVPVYDRHDGYAHNRPIPKPDRYGRH